MLKFVGDVLGQILNRRRYGLSSLLVGFALAPLWQLYKRIIGLPLVLTTWKGTLFLLEPKSITSSRFVYELHPDERFIERLAVFAGKPEDNVTFVDVGANVGLFTVLLCRTFSRGVMFEPNPVAAAMARRNVALNEVSDKYRLIEAAVGKTLGTVAIPKVGVPDPALRVRYDAVDGVESLLVPMITLDSAIPDGAVVMKIDAEGFDADVVEGFSAAFASYRVRLCLFESAENEILERVLSIVTEKGYSVMDGSRQISRIDDARGRDLFIVRNDLLPVYRCVVEA